MSHPVDGDVHVDPTPRPGDRGFRASDADRQLTVMALQDAVSRGLLTPEEGSVRMEAAYAATHHADLPPLTADLPPAEPAPWSKWSRRGPRAGCRSAPGFDWRARGFAAAGTLRSALTALILIIGGTGKRRRLRLGIAAVVAVLAMMATFSLVGHVFTGDEVQPGAGGFPGGAGARGRHG